MEKSIFRLKHILTLLLILFLMLHVLLKIEPSKSPVVIAHRGASGTMPENTIASIVHAVESGADYIEVDVQRTADNVLVLLHDNTIDRTTSGTGKINQLAWKTIEALEDEHPIPTLEEAIAIIVDSNTNLVLELKKPSNYPGIEKQVVELLNTAKLQKQVTIISFNHVSLEKIRSLSQDIQLGHLHAQAQFIPYAQNDRFVSALWTNVIFDPTFMWRQKRQNREVWVWTVDNIRLMRLLVWFGVDGITTNHPERWPL